MQFREKRALNLPRAARIGSLRHPLEHAVHDHQIEAIGAERHRQRITADDVDVREAVLRQPPFDEAAPSLIALERDHLIKCSGQTFRDDAGSGSDIERATVFADGKSSVELGLPRVGKPELLPRQHGQVQARQRAAPAARLVHRREQPVELIGRKRALTRASSLLMVIGVGPGPHDAASSVLRQKTVLRSVPALSAAPTCSSSETNDRQKTAGARRRSNRPVISTR